MVGWFVNDEVKSMRKEAVVAYFEGSGVGLMELSKASFRLYVWSQDNSAIKQDDWRFFFSYVGFEILTTALSSGVDRLVVRWKSAD
jgi:hypothetical protein